MQVHIILITIQFIKKLGVLNSILNSLLIKDKEADFLFTFLTNSVEAAFVLLFLLLRSITPSK